MSFSLLSSLPDHLLSKWMFRKFWGFGAPWPLTRMADSSMVTLGTARSLLVDSSVYDSKIIETTKDHTFLGMTLEDGEGESACILLSFPASISAFLYSWSTVFQVWRVKLKIEVSCFTGYVELKVCFQYCEEGSVWAWWLSAGLCQGQIPSSPLCSSGETQAITWDTGGQMASDSCHRRWKKEDTPHKLSLQWHKPVTCVLIFYVLLSQWLRAMHNSHNAFV